MPDAPAPLLRRILLALDAAAPSEEAIAWAGLLARRAGATVDAVTVLPHVPLAVRIGSRLESGAGAREAMAFQDAGMGKGLESLASAFHGVPYLPHVLHGDPAESLLLLDRRLRPDLLVVGPPGREAGNRHGVADDLRHHATADVLVARSVPRPTQGLVVGSDGSENAVRAVAKASGLASLLRCGLQVVQARPPGGHEALGPSTERLRELHPEAARLPEARFDVTNLPAAATLLEAASTAALCVVGSRGLGPLAGRMLGSVSDRVSRDASGSVLVVR